MSADASSVDLDRVKARQVELISRLKAEPGVIGVTFSSGIPGFAGSDRIRFEEGVRLRERADHVPDVGVTNALVPSVVRASVDLFDTYGVQILAGRNFMASDVGVNNVVVNRSFAEMYLQNGNALGLRFRYIREEADPARAPWYQIVGVVRDFPPSLPT
jgi:hypothetical protein